MSIRCLMKFAGPIITCLSFERILKKHPNGGEVVFLRALLIALVFYILNIVAKFSLDPLRDFSFQEIRIEMAGTLSTFGAIFTGVYIALYSRFASQWTYLANLYNKIKEAELGTVLKRETEPQTAAMKIVAQWKAAFLEDAEDLHLATKPIFASVIAKWAENTVIRNSFVAQAPGGEARFDKLKRRVDAAHALHRKKYE